MIAFTHITFGKWARKFAGREEGAVLVEFALVLPLMLLFFAIMVESARTYYSYQVAISGVRDAVRYVGRVAPVNICNTPGANLTGYTTKVTDIVSKDMAGNGVFVPKVTVNSVTPVHSCVAGTYRTSPAPIATVTASVTVEYPLGFLFTWFGPGLNTANITIEDQTRIIGQ